MTNAVYKYYYASVRMRKRGIHSSVFVCVCVCVDCYSCSVINEVQVIASIGLLSRFLGFQFVDLQIKLRSRVLLTLKAIEVSSDSCVAKSRFILVSSALERYW